MPYIANKPATNFETVQKQISTSNSGTTITLDRAVTSVQDILLTIDAVVQSYDNYSVSGTTLTVGGTLNNNRVEILYVGRTMQSVDPTDDSVSAAKIKTDAVTTAKVQNDAITVDKLNLISTSSVPSLEAKGDGSSVAGKIKLNCHVNSHGVTLQSPDHSSSQSWTLKLPDNSPTADKFLKVKSITGSGSTATGQLEFADAGGGGMVLVGQSVDTASGGTTYSGISFDDVFSATYDNYLIVASFTTETDGDNVRMRFREGGSDFTAGSYVYSFREHNINNSNSGSFSSSGYWGQTYIDITSSQTNHISNHATLFGYVFLPFVNDARTQFMFQSNGYTSSNAIKNRNTAAKYNAAHNTADGFTLYAESGNIDEHSIQIFGIKKS